MLFRTLSGRLLFLTVAFVMLAEVLIFLPSVSQFRVDYMRTRLERAQIASLALLATPDAMIAPELEQELLDNSGVLNIVLQREARRELVLSLPMPRPVDQTVDLRTETTWALMRDAVLCFVLPADRIIRVIGPPVKGGGLVIEASIEEAPLREAMLLYGGRIFVLSLAISLFAGFLLFLAVRRFIARPILHVAENMARFREDPEDASRVIEPSSGIGEVAGAERALKDLQLQLRAALKQKERLAALGGAVARISHDLRNMLTTAQLLADRIEMSRDPAVQRVAPKLLASLDRAIGLCERTLDYGRSEEPRPVLRLVRLSSLIEELVESEMMAVQNERIEFTNEVSDTLTLNADPEQLFRILSNLIRNARQAIEATGRGGAITVRAEISGPQLRIEVRDTGPGLPSRALENLFQPFRGGIRQGGSGLGLAIAAELVRGHGGVLQLLETSTEGTAFRIDIPIVPAASETDAGETDAGETAPSGDHSPLQPDDATGRYAARSTRSSAG